MASYDKNLTLCDKSISGVIDQNIVALYHYTSYAYHIYIKASLISKKGIAMNVNYIKLLSTITILTVSMNVTAGFDENFSEDALNPSWGTKGDGHQGISNKAYNMTDAADSSSTELFRNIQDIPSASFQTSIGVLFNKFVTPNTKTAFTWTLNGHSGNVSIIYNSFGKLELRHNDFDGENKELASNNNIGVKDGSIVSFTLKYDHESGLLEAFYTGNDGVDISFYKGLGAADKSFDDFFSLRSTAKLYKFDDTPADQASISINSWKMN